MIINCSLIPSGSSNETEIGLNSLALLADATHLAEPILRAQLVRYAAPFMLDRELNLESRLAAVGACHNLSLVSPDICHQMVSQDIMTPLGALLPLIEPHNPHPAQIALGVEALSLLWNLCEASDLAWQIFHQRDWIPALLRCLTPETPAKLVLPALQCLLTVCEGHPPAIAALQAQSDFLPALLARPTDSGPARHVQMLAVGVALNVHPSGRDRAGPEVLNVLADGLSLDPRQMVRQNYPFMMNPTNIMETDRDESLIIS